MAEKKCPTCGDEGLIRSVQSGCHVPCPTCRVSNAAAHHKQRDRFEIIANDAAEATLIQRMTPEERAYLAGRLVEREGPDTGEDRAALFEQMRRMVSKRCYGTPYSMGEARSMLLAWPRWPSMNKAHHDYLRGLVAWLCCEVDRLNDRVAEQEKTYDAAISELPDDPPGGYTLPQAVRAMQRRIDTLEEALKFYADNKNYEAKRAESSPVFVDYGLAARDALLNPRNRKRITDQDIENVRYVKALKGLTDCSSHGRGDAEDGPDDFDCPCRETAAQKHCAAQGCGFCKAAEDRRRLLSRDKGEDNA